MLEEQEITEFELEQDGVKLRICRSRRGTAAPVVVSAPIEAVAAPPPPCRLPAPLRRRPAAAASAARRQPPEAPPAGTAVESPIVGTFYRAPGPELAAVRERGRPGAGGPGALHHRGDEAHERDRGRGGAARSSRSTRTTASPSSTGIPSSPSGPPEGPPRPRIRDDVQEDPHRQPGRDRAPGSLGLQGARGQDGGGVLRGRRERPARALRRRGGVHRPSPEQRVLSRTSPRSSPRPRSPAPTPSTPATASCRSPPISRRSARPATSPSSDPVPRRSA